MGRNNTQAMTNIRMLCRVQHLDERALYARSKLILSIYRDVCWSAVGRANDIESDLMETCGSALDSALIYLETFAPDETRGQFEERVQSLFETRWIVELIESTMVRIRDYPVRGDLYCEILNLCYLNRFKYKETELLEILHIERSSFYDRKKEAVLLFGLSLWGTAIPQLKNFLGSVQYDLPNAL